MSSDDFYTPPAQPPTKKQLCNAILALKEVQQALQDAKLRASRFENSDYRRKKMLGFVQVTCDRHALHESVADLQAEADTVIEWCTSLIEGYHSSSHGDLTQEEEALAKQLTFLIGFDL